jgi:hypothetical protein
MTMAMPRPGPEHDNLKRLTGKWPGPETMMPSPWSPQQQERHCRIDARMLDGFFVISDYEQRAGDQVTFRGHGVYGWDPEAEEYLMYWFDSMGGAGGVARGHLDGNRRTFQNTSPMGQHRYRYTFGEDETVFEMAMSNDGKKWNVPMEGRYKPR